MTGRTGDRKRTSLRDDREYFTKRSSIRNAAKSNGYRYSTEEIDQFVVSEGLQTLDDVLGTLSLKSFRLYNSPELYDEYGRRFKLDKSIQERNSYYVIYRKGVTETNRIVAGDTIRLFNGTSSPVTIVVKHVVENVKRQLSATIFVE